MNKARIMVFPAGTEIGLTIYDSLRHMPNVEIFGGSSADDHARFAFKEKYAGDFPYVADPGFIEYVAWWCKQAEIDYIYPAHDDVIFQLTKHRDQIPAEIIAPDFETVEVCRSKTKTYDLFPEISPQRTMDLPMFAKPDRGQGSRGAYKIETEEQFKKAVLSPEEMCIREYLPGPEYTVDCFTDRHGKLRFCEGRQRSRIKNGISVRTERVEVDAFRVLALGIMEKLKMRGQWFFQVKEKQPCLYRLLEIAPRPAGSSVLWTAHGVWLPQLTVLDRMGEDIEIKFNDQRIEMDRALGYRFLYHKKQA